VLARLDGHGHLKTDRVGDHFMTIPALTCALASPTLAPR
jgi:hypothetical protein